MNKISKELIFIIINTKILNKLFYKILCYSINDATFSI
jgi:hypothetical protein